MKRFLLTATMATRLFLLLACISMCLAQNPFYGNQTPPPYDQNQDGRRQNDSNYDRYNYETGNRYDSTNRYNSDRYDPNNRYNNNDPYNRNNDSGRYPNDNRYNNNNDPNNRYNDPNNRYNNDPNNRYNQDRYNQDQYNRYNTTSPYNLGSDLNPNYRNNERYPDPNSPYNRYNNSSNNPYNRDYNNPNDRYNNPFNRNNDPNNRYNDANNRYNDPNNRYNDPNNRYNDSNNRYNDPNNRYNDPNNRYNDPNNRYNQQNRYNDRNPNQQNRPFDPRFRDDDRQDGQDLQNDPNDSCCEDYCYRSDENPTLYFGSKTAYQIVYDRRGVQDVPECSPVQIWSINRHGTRFPTEQEIRRLRGLENLRSEILKNYDEKRSFPFKGKLCPQDIDLIRRWRWNDSMTENREKVLTSQGIEDAKFLARRFKSRFSGLLSQSYRENYYNFQYDTSDYKTHDTYQAYIEGLFDLSKSYNVHANTDMNERILPPSYCKFISREVENNNYTFSEYDRFKNKQDYRQMTRDVFKRLGFRYKHDDSVIRNMYDMCRYEKAWYLNDPSPWCSVFTKSQLELLEYAEDLQEYFYSGYGSFANAKVGCLLVKDMYQMMKKVVNGEAADTYKVANYFTQSTQFLRFLTALGVARDYSPLSADNYYQQRTRQWRLSVIDPFGANLVAVLYNCQRENKFKVMFLLNEKPVNFPECSVGLCDWSVLEQRLMPIAENCNRDYCERGGSSALYSVNIISLLLTAISLIFLTRQN